MSVLIVTENGYASASAEKEFVAKARGGKGVNGMLIDEKTGPVVAIELPVEGVDIIVVTKKGKTAKFAASEVRETYRGSGGVKVIDLAEDDKVVDCVMVS